MLVLPVQVDQGPQSLRERRDRGHLLVERAPGPAVVASAAAYQQLLAGQSESSLHERLAAAAPHDRRVGPLAEEQLERAEERGLPGAGLACEHGHARPELEPGVLDEGEIAYVQLFEQPIAPEELRGHDVVEVAAIELDQEHVVVPRGTVTRSIGCGTDWRRRRR